jgi:hypothetical protein
VLCFGLASDRCGSLGGRTRTGAIASALTAEDCASDEAARVGFAGKSASATKFGLCRTTSRRCAISARFSSAVDVVLPPASVAETGRGGGGRVESSLASAASISRCGRVDISACDWSARAPAFRTMVQCAAPDAALSAPAAAASILCPATEWDAREVKGIAKAAGYGRLCAFEGA